MTKKSTLTNERYRKNSGVYEIKFKFRIYPSEGELKARLQAIREAEGIAPYIKRLIREDLLMCETQFRPAKFVSEGDCISLGGDVKKIVVGNINHHQYIRLTALIGKEDADIYIERAREFLARKPNATVNASHILKWYSEDNNKNNEWLKNARDEL